MTVLVSFNWMAWHRRLGLITCFGILMWGVSGFSHPIMTRLQPMPAAFVPPAQSIDLRDALTINQVLAGNAINQVQRVAVATISGQPYYRVSIRQNEPARYFLAGSGKELIDGDRLYAEMLASHYTGLPQEKITNSRLIVSFDDDYHAVNRLLPVWRVEFTGDSHLRAFVETDQARLSTLVDDTRYNLTRLFSLGHNWAFANGMPALQLSVMALVLCVTLFSASSGLYLFFSRRRNASQRLAKNPVKCWHRRLGLAVALSTLLFASSGAFHLIMSFQQARNENKLTAPEDVLASQLSDHVWHEVASKPLAKLDLVSSAGKPMWLVHPANGQSSMPRAQVGALAQKQNHHNHGHDSSVPKEKSNVILLAADQTAMVEAGNLSIFELAQTQAASYANLPIDKITHTELVSQFGSEYGFIFKRLPVVKVAFNAPGNPRYYIEPATGVLASKVKDIDALEGFTFAYFHKWSIPGVNTDLRDVIVMLFALGNIIVALLGATLFARKI